MSHPYQKPHGLKKTPHPAPPVDDQYTSLKDLVTEYLSWFKLQQSDSLGTKQRKQVQHNLNTARVRMALSVGFELSAGTSRGKGKK